MSDDLSGATLAAVTAIVDRALDEDAPWGDATSEAAIPASATAIARIVSRVHGVLAGGLALQLAFTRVDPTLVVERSLADGDPIAPGVVVATITGSARSILRGERVALNLAQRLSGVATLTRRYVDAVAGAVSASGAPVRLVDTRKTTPGLRVLEKAAVRLTGAIRAVRARIPHTMHLEVEVDRLDQLEAVIAAEPDTIMLDNFGLDDLRAGVALIAGRATVEASGGVTLDTVRAIAETGVDVISVGALTHSAPALDLGLDIAITPGSGGAAGGAR
ncbi:MAG: nicotinate-nucleotide diphosphorylase (carboxylating) [Micrococcales bacterium 32-70-13]|nr:MAG: nicotinate-nucleotide diphosphorylase (carboxylating) [Micrococcales bacterium 32-70-13]